MKTSGISLRFRIWLLIGVLVGLAAITGYTGVQTSRVFSGQFEPLKDRELVAADLLWEASVDAYFVTRPALELGFLGVKAASDGWSLELEGEIELQHVALAEARKAAEATLAEMWTFAEHFPETREAVRILEEDQRAMFANAEALAAAAAAGRTVTELAALKQVLEVSYDRLQDHLMFAGIRNNDVVLRRLERVDAAGNFFDRALLVLAGLGMLVLGAAAVVLGRYERAVARPILALQRAAAAMKAGDLGARAPIRGEANVARLSETFNAMAAKLEDELAARERSKSELAVARDQALEASRLKSEFLANMSHEVRTPLNGVIGMATLLLDTDLDAEQREHVTVVVRSAKSLLQVLDDVLDLSKIEAGRLELDPQPLDLEHLAHEVSELMGAAAESKGLRLVLRVAPGTPRQLVGDGLRLRQVLANLLGNAVKFTDHGHVMLDIEQVDGGEASAQRARIRFTVEDTGIGIPEGRLESIFDAFSQADASTTRRHGGSGLGLTICRRLVRLLGGELQVASSLGAGSRFWFEIELERRHEASAEASGESDLRRARVLLVDEDPIQSGVLLELLESWHLRATGANDEPGALESLRLATSAGDPFDLVVLSHDSQIDGFALGASIAADERIQRPRLVLLTPIAARFDRERLQSSPFSCSLARPVTPSELYDSLANAWLGGPSRSGAQPTEPTRPARPTPGGGPLVLVVEDNEINRRVAVRQLEKLGCRVESAADGADALRRVASGSYDVVFMDCQMPEMDGFEATARIRALPTPAASAPIIALTAHAMAGDRERCLAAGMTDYLPKPLDAGDLAKMLLRYAPPGRSAQKTTGAKSAVNEEKLLEVLDGDLELLAELVDLVRAELQRHLAAIGPALDEGDLSVVERVAHTLKGTMLNVHAGAAAALAHELEVAARESDAERCRPFVPRLREAAEGALDELVAVLERKRAEGSDDVVATLANAS